MKKICLIIILLIQSNQILAHQDFERPDHHDFFVGTTEYVGGINISKPLGFGASFGVFPWFKRHHGEDESSLYFGLDVAKKGQKLSIGYGYMDGSWNNVYASVIKISALSTNDKVNDADIDSNYLGIEIEKMFMLVNASIGYFHKISNDKDDDFIELSVGFGF